MDHELNKNKKEMLNDSPRATLNNHCEIMRINEIIASDLCEDQSLRTWGKIIIHDIHSQQAILSDHGEQLCVNTAAIEPCQLNVGSFYNLLGNIIKTEESVMLQVRAATCINELDFDVFEKAFELRRKFLRKEYGS